MKTVELTTLELDVIAKVLDAAYEHDAPAWDCISDDESICETYANEHYKLIKKFMALVKEVENEQS